MIEAAGLGRAFGERWVLKDVSFGVKPGEFIGVMGRNGAGKTTLIRLLTGQLTPTAGRARIAEKDVSARPLALRQMVGVMPEEDALLEDLGGAQYLNFVGRIHGLDPSDLTRRIGELQDCLDVDFHVSTAIRDYSFGMKKKLAFSSALLHGPRLLFLDEPFEGLDPAIAQTMLELLASLHRKGMTIVMASHLLGMAERLCTRFLLIEGGTLKLDQSADALRASGEGLEAVFLRLIGKEAVRELTWI